jgi:hypothetical protein
MPIQQINCNFLSGRMPKENFELVINQIAKKNTTLQIGFDFDIFRHNPSGHLRINLRF